MKTLLTETEKQYIRENHLQMTVLQMAQSLGRNHSGIYTYLQRNGLEITTKKSLIKRARPEGKFFNIHSESCWITGFR